MSQNNIRYIILTGAPGVGKTTLVKKVCNALTKQNISLKGFFTEEIRSGGERVGFDVVLLNDSKRAPLARLKCASNQKQPSVGKYAVDVTSFESCVLPLMKSFAKLEDKFILVLDEIGKMELLSEQFKHFGSSCFQNKNGVILATIPLKTANPIPLIEMVKCHPSTLLLTVDKENRNQLEQKIVKCIIDADRKKTDIEIKQLS